MEATLSLVGLWHCGSYPRGMTAAGHALHTGPLSRDLSSPWRMASSPTAASSSFSPFSKQQEPRQADCKGRKHSGSTSQSFCHSLGEPEEQPDFEEMKQDNASPGPRAKSTSTLQEGTCHSLPRHCLPTGALFPSVVDTDTPIFRPVNAWCLWVL